MCYLSFKAQKLPFLAVLTRFLILGKLQDGDYCWWRHRPPAAPPPIKYTSFCYENQRLSTKGKIVSKYCNIQKTPGKSSIHPPPAPYTTVGVWICLYVRGLRNFSNNNGNYKENRRYSRCGLANQQLFTCITLFCTLLYHHCRFHRKRKQVTAKFFFLLLNLRAVPNKQTSGKFAYISHFQRTVINATKSEKTRIHIWSDVFAALRAVVHAKAPYYCWLVRRGQH